MKYAGTVVACASSVRTGGLGPLADEELAGIEVAAAELDAVSVDEETSREDDEAALEDRGSSDDGALVALLDGAARLVAVDVAPEVADVAAEDAGVDEDARELPAANDEDEPLLAALPASAGSSEGGRGAQALKRENTRQAGQARMKVTLHGDWMRRKPGPGG